LRRMVSFGIFPGAARRDSLLAAVVYGPEEYARVFGGNPDGYQDFLIRQEEFLRPAYAGERGPVRVKRVPFVRAEFERWVARHPGLGDTPDVHGAWALEVASDPAWLRDVERLTPVIPRAPVESRFLAEGWCLAVTLPSPCDWAMGAALPVDAAEDAGRLLKGVLKGCPSLSRLSPVRASGVEVVGALGFCGPEGADMLCVELEGRVELAWLKGELLPAVHVPRRFRPGVSRDGGWSVVAWPFLLAGAAGDVLYAGQVLAGEEAADAEELAMAAVLGAAGVEPDPGWPVRCLPLQDLSAVAGRLLAQAPEEEEWPVRF